MGKASKKQQSQATVLMDGYAAHLTMLMSHGGSRPAQGNARMVIPRGYFGLPGQSFSRRRRYLTFLITLWRCPERTQHDLIKLNCNTILLFIQLCRENKSIPKFCFCL